MLNMDLISNYKKTKLLNLFFSITKSENIEKFLDSLFIFLKNKFSIQEIIFWHYDSPNNILVQKKSTSKFHLLNNTYINDQNSQIWRCFIGKKIDQISSSDSILKLNNIDIDFYPKRFYYFPFYCDNQSLGIFLFKFKKNISGLQKFYKIEKILKDVSRIYSHLLNEIKVEDQNEALKIINIIGKKLSESNDINVIYEIFQNASYQLLPNTSTIIFSLFDDQTNLIHPAYLHHEGQIVDISKLNPIPLEPPGKGFQSQAIRSKKPLIINNLQKDLDEKVSNYQKFGTDKDGTQSSIYVPMLARNKVLGVINLQSFQNYYYNQNLAKLFTTLANTAAVAIQNILLFETEKEHNEMLKNAYEQTLIGWAKAVELKDHETEKHNLRVANLTRIFAEKLNLSEFEIDSIYKGALLHDIGKIAIPDSILNKPGKLSQKEWEIVKQHPIHAKKMLSDIEFLKESIDIPYLHHERWDGTGYPKGLSKKEIPLGARIFCIVDVYDALSSDRPYRQAWSQEKIIQYLKSQANKHFDPDLLEEFFKVIIKFSDTNFT